jgi:hypothetical protein
MLAIFCGFIAFVLLLTLVFPKSYTTTVKLIAGKSAGAAQNLPPGDGPNSDLPVLNALLSGSSLLPGDVRRAVSRIPGSTASYRCLEA